MKEAIEPLEEPKDFAKALHADGMRNLRELYEQAIICLDAQGLAQFMREICIRTPSEDTNNAREAMMHANPNSGLLNPDSSSAMFYQALRHCYGTKEGGLVSEQKLTELCVILSDITELKPAIQVIVEIMRNRNERSTIQELLAAKTADRSALIKDLISPDDTGGRESLESGMAHVLRYREELAQEAGYDLRKREGRTPFRIFVMDQLLAMPITNLQDLDKFLNVELGYGIGALARSIETHEHWSVVEAYLADPIRTRKSATAKHLLALVS